MEGEGEQAYSFVIALYLGEVGVHVCLHAFPPLTSSISLHHPSPYVVGYNLPFHEWSLQFRYAYILLTDVCVCVHCVCVCVCACGVDVISLVCATSIFQFRASNLLQARVDVA